MNYRAVDALVKANESGAHPIKAVLESDGYYVLRGANGERRRIAAGKAQTYLAAANWPEHGKNAVMWMYADRIESRRGRR